LQPGSFFNSPQHLDDAAFIPCIGAACINDKKYITGFGVKLALKTPQGCGANIVTADINNCVPPAFKDTVNCGRQSRNIGA
jgi:hypothetical protein